MERDQIAFFFKFSILILILFVPTQKNPIDHMMAAAFEIVIPQKKNRVMAPELLQAYCVATKLVNRFDIWRTSKIVFWSLANQSSVEMSPPTSFWPRIFTFYCAGCNDFKTVHCCWFLMSLLLMCCVSELTLKEMF